jgi:hypothetical protein
MRFRFLLGGSIFAASLGVFGTIAGCGSTNEPVVAKDFLVVTPDTVTSTADTYAIVTLSASTNAALHPIGTPVTFTASAGTFLPSGSTVVATTDGAGVARAQLRAPSDSVVARVSATVGNLIAYNSVTFTRALPDQITLGADRVTVSASAAPGAVTPVKLTATLVRRFGVAGPGQVVQFTAYALGDPTQRRGVWSPPSVLATATSATSPPAAMTTFFADGADAGFVVLRAQLATNPNIKDEVVVQVVRDSSTASGSLSSARPWTTRSIRESLRAVIASSLFQN